MDFEPLNADQAEDGWVTLTRCFKLVEADLMAAQLRAAGVPVFIPDEFLMQAICFNLNTYGFVRVQVPRSRYEEAREIVLAAPVAAEGEI